MMCIIAGDFEVYCKISEKETSTLWKISNEAFVLPGIDVQIFILSNRRERFCR